MTTKLNAHKLLFSAPAEVDFHSQIGLDEARIKRLREARDLVRAEISAAFGHWATFVSPNLVLEQSYLRKSGAQPLLRPKFRGQGSYAYKTLIDPAHQPPQRVDFDDGVFLPVTFLKLQAQQHHATPLITSKGYFALIEAVLTPLCKRQRWALARDKSSCVRVVLDARSHLDLALYAIPDAEFDSLLEKALATEPRANRVLASGELRLHDHVYMSLREDQIMLAHRDDGWIPSDPRKLEKWFQEAIRTHGDQLRRVCRYGKAWRDLCWPNGCKLSSIAIMKVVVDAFDNVRGQFADNRDDAALLMVARKMQEAFGDTNGIVNPVLPGRVLLNANWESKDFVTYAQAAGRLAGQLARAIETNNNPTVAVACIVGVLGTRVPSDESLVVQVSAEDTVKEYARVKVPQPHIVRSQSG